MYCFREIDDEMLVENCLFAPITLEFFQDVCCQKTIEECGYRVDNFCEGHLGVRRIDTFHAFMFAVPYVC